MMEEKQNQPPMKHIHAYIHIYHKNLKTYTYIISINMYTYLYIMQCVSFRFVSIDESKEQEEEATNKKNDVTQKWRRHEKMNISC